MTITVNRTVVFNLWPNDEQRVALEETTRLYTMAWRDAVDVAWEMENPTKVSVHKLVYKDLKEKLGLKSQYLCSSRNRAVESVKSARELQQKGKKVSKPTAGRHIPVRLDARTLSFDKTRETASIATQHGRIKVPLVWHSQAQRYRDWFCQAGEFALNRKGRWVLRLVFTKNEEVNYRKIWCCDWCG